MNRETPLEIEAESTDNSGVDARNQRTSTPDHDPADGGRTAMAAHTVTQVSDYTIVQAMARYGGSFARALAEACHHTDPEHLARIKAAFPQLWDEYAELARLAAARAK